MISRNTAFVAVTSVIAYALPTYVIVAPAYTVNQFNVAQWLAFLIVSIPFGGRVIGALSYQKIIVSLGSRLTFLTSLFSLGIISIASGIVSNIGILIVLRLLVGVMFGLATSFAVEQAIKTGNRFITALTMSGWAIGWIGGAFAYLDLKTWYLIALSGGITIPLSLLYQKTDSFKGEKIKLGLPSLLSVLAFFFAFEPAFILQLAPTILEKEGGLSWLILGYSISVPMYFIIPALARILGETKAIIISTSISALSGTLFFVTGIPYLVVIFNAFGLGINSLAPRISQFYGAGARNMGVALNAAALGGVIVPVVGSINIKIVASLITAISMIALLIMGIKVREGIAVGNYRSTSNYSSISNSVERYNLKYIKIINKLQNYITRSFKRINLSNKRVLAILSTIDFHFYHRFG
ncbi:transporter [Acidianus brierleyi]|uniref:transporter n=1 Tax=Acidianus brierleyi TaxID=41673 RepID=UPI001B310BDD|nr:transporter [Acidianus brierleyi]